MNQVREPYWIGPQPTVSAACRFGSPVRKQLPVGIPPSPLIPQISYPFLVPPRLLVRPRVLRRQRNQPQSMIAEWLGWLCAQSFFLFQFARRGSFPHRLPYPFDSCCPPLRSC